MSTHTMEKAPLSKRFWIAPVVIAAAIGFLVFSGMKATTMRNVPVDSLRADAASEKKYAGQRLRVVGFVGKTPVKKTPLKTEQGTVNVSHFEVEGEKSGIVQVQYKDALPDSFRAGGPVQIDGVYDGKGSINADHVLTKCPSKYESERPSIKEQKASGSAARRAMLSQPVR